MRWLIDRSRTVIAPARAQEPALGIRPRLKAEFLPVPARIDLSIRRAHAVREALVRGGMEAGAVKAIGLGEANPIESNRTASGRQENRRVVIIITAADAF